MDQSWFTCGVHTGPLQGHRDDDAVAQVSSRALPGFLPALPPETRPWPVSKAGILGWICLSWFKSPRSLYWSDLVNREFYKHQGFNPLRLSKPSTSLWTCQIRGHGGFFSVRSFWFLFVSSALITHVADLYAFLFPPALLTHVYPDDHPSYGSSSEVVCVQAYGWPPGWPHHLLRQLSAASDVITSSTRGNLWFWEKQLYTPGWLTVFCRTPQCTSACWCWQKLGGNIRFYYAEDIIWSSSDLLFIMLYVFKLGTLMLHIANMGCLEHIVICSLVA